jgi:hypothetical protein
VHFRGALFTTSPDFPKSRPLTKSTPEQQIPRRVYMTAR